MRKKIGELLVASGAVTEEQLQEALKKKGGRNRGQRVGEVLVALGYATPRVVAQALARQYELPFIDLPRIAPAVARLVPVEFQSRHRLVPFKVDTEGRTERLHVAVDDPTSLSRVDELRSRLRRPVLVHVASAEDLDKALARARGEIEDTEELGVEDLVEEADSDDADELIIEHGNTSMVSGGRFDQGGTDSRELPPLEVGDATAVKLRPGPPARSSARPPPPPPPPPDSKADSKDVLDDLLGVRPPPHVPPPPPPPEPPARPRVPLVVFGGAASSVQPPEPPQPLDFSEEDLAVLEDLDRMATGNEVVLDTEKVKPARMVATLIRLLIRKRVINELEFLEELSHK
jgi:hypothetical protein